MSLPQEFRLSISSFYGRSFSIILRDEKIIYTATRPAQKLVRDPAPRDWDHFWKATVNHKIWLWNREYLDTSSSDGDNWSLKISIGKLSIHSYGSNDRPDNFNEFLESVKKLIPGIEIH